MTKRRIAAIALIVVGCGDNPSSLRPDAREVADARQEVDSAEQTTTVRITSPANQARIVGGRTVTVSGTVSNPAVTMVTVAIGNRSVTATVTAGMFAVPMTLDAGAQTIVVTATGPSGASASDSIAVMYPFVALNTFDKATLVLGQAKFDTAANPSTATATSIPDPYGNPLWHDGTLFVPSSTHNRVLGYRGFPSRNNEPADFVLGQPDFTSSGAATGARGMEYPQTIGTTDGKLFVLDFDNQRVLGWNSVPSSGQIPADLVLGQPDFATRATGCSQARQASADDLFVGAGKVILADSRNHRLLIWNTVPQATGALPDLVLGQADFTHCANNDDNQDGTADATPTARTLRSPQGVWTDGNKLIVADGQNHRVLVWRTFPTTSFTPADVVIGQPNFTTRAEGVAAGRFTSPSSVASNGNQLFLTDFENDRILVWNQIPDSDTPADLVLGQASFTGATDNDDNQDGIADAAPTACTLSGPVGLTVTDDNLVVSDTYNHRMLVFGKLPCPEGQYQPSAQPGTCIADPCFNHVCNTGLCRNDTGVAVCQ